MSTSLYFVALIPPPLLQEQVRSLQRDIADRFESRAALKSPVHITLVPPVNLSDSAAVLLQQVLQVASQEVSPFAIDLENFAVFAPRVLYIHVQPCVALKTLWENLSDRLQQNPSLKTPLNQRHTHPFTPHITIGFRDLSLQNFHQAWAEFQQRSFRAHFRATELTLLQHNGQDWEAIATFPFTGSLETSLERPLF